MPGQSLAQEKLWGRKGVESSFHTYSKAWGGRRAQTMQLEACSHLAFVVVSCILHQLSGSPIARAVCIQVFATADKATAMPHHRVSTYMPRKSGRALQRALFCCCMMACRETVRSVDWAMHHPSFLQTLPTIYTLWDSQCHFQSGRTEETQTSITVLMVAAGMC